MLAWQNQEDFGRTWNEILQHVWPRKRFQNLLLWELNRMDISNTGLELILLKRFFNAHNKKWKGLELYFVNYK